MNTIPQSNSSFHPWKTDQSLTHARRTYFSQQKSKKIYSQRRTKFHNWSFIRSGRFDKVEDFVSLCRVDLDCVTEQTLGIRSSIDCSSKATSNLERKDLFFYLKCFANENNRFSSSWRIRANCSSLIVSSVVVVVIDAGRFLFERRFDDRLFASASLCRPSFVWSCILRAKSASVSSLNRRKIKSQRKTNENRLTRTFSVWTWEVGTL